MYSEGKGLTKFSGIFSTTLSFVFWFIFKHFWLTIVALQIGDTFFSWVEPALGQIIPCEGIIGIRSGLDGKRILYIEKYVIPFFEAFDCECAYVAHTEEEWAGAFSHEYKGGWYRIKWFFPPYEGMHFLFGFPIAWWFYETCFEDAAPGRDYDPFGDFESQYIEDEQILP